MKHLAKRARRVPIKWMRNIAVVAIVALFIVMIVTSVAFVANKIGAGYSLVWAIPFLATSWAIFGVLALRLLVMVDQCLASETLLELIGWYLVCGYSLDKLLEADVPIRLCRRIGCDCGSWFAVVTMIALGDNDVEARLCYGVRSDYEAHTWVEYKYLGIWWAVDPIYMDMRNVPCQRWVYRMYFRPQVTVVHNHAALRQTCLLENTKRFLMEHRYDIKKLMDDRTLHA